MYLTHPTESGSASNGAERKKDADIVAVIKHTVKWDKSEFSKNFLALRALRALEDVGADWALYNSARAAGHHPSAALGSNLDDCRCNARLGN